MTSLVKPEHPISFEAMACHHIVESMVADAPSLEQVLADFPGISRTEYFAAHNAPFDRKYLPSYLQDKPWLDTYRIALHLWPDAPSHSNQVLRYWMGLDVSDMPAEAGGMAHRALYDAFCTTKLLEKMIATVCEDCNMSFEDAVQHLLELSAAPVVLRKVRFGKHRDELWKDVPKSYLQWISKQTDMNADVLFTAKHYLST
jgi:exodeoxyribonuclease X